MNNHGVSSVTHRERRGALLEHKGHMRVGLRVMVRRLPGEVERTWTPELETDLGLKAMETWANHLTSVIQLPNLLDITMLSSLRCYEV